MKKKNTTLRRGSTRLHVNPLATSQFGTIATRSPNQDAGWRKSLDSPQCADEDAGKSADDPSPWNVFYVMKFHPPSRTRLRMRPSPRYLALLLLPVLAPEYTSAAPRPRPSAGLAVRFFPEPPIAYLRHIDPVELRIRPTPPPPAPWPKTLDPVAIEVDDPAVNEATMPSSIGSSEPPAPEATSGFVERGPPAETLPPGELHSANTGADEPSVVSSPAPILIDDLRTTVRPEDFLPFFLLPGTHSGDPATTVVVPVPHQAPAPAVQPLSSATFTRSP